MSRLYLDNAATSYPKPATVWEAVENYQRHLGAAVGRGGYNTSQTVGQIVQRARYRLAELFRAESSDRIVFGFNGTDVPTRRCTVCCGLETGLSPHNWNTTR